MTPLERALASVDNANPYRAATIRGMLAGYDKRYRDEQREIVVNGIEQQLYSALPRPDGSACEAWRLCGVIDKTGPTSIVDHKTTAMEIERDDAAYWQMMDLDGQPSQYQLLMYANGVKVMKTVWDVSRKPTIRPKKPTKIQLRELAESGAYLGESLPKIQMIEGDKETPAMFEIRVRQTIDADLDRYFKRRTVTRTNEELAEYLNELYLISREMMSTRDHGSHFRNPGSCFLYNTPCKFLGLCSGWDSPDSAKWEKKAIVHGELDLDYDGRDLLTNSRVKCYQACRRKHYYEYEEGIQRVDEEEREPLVFGTAWHLAMDAYWAACNEERLKEDEL